MKLLNVSNSQLKAYVLSVIKGRPPLIHQHLAIGTRRKQEEMQHQNVSTCQSTAQYSLKVPVKLQVVFGKLLNVKLKLVQIRISAQGSQLLVVPENIAKR